MTDSEIVKALRCCADRYCKGCSEHEKANCKETISALAWDLIIRQQEENKKLKRLVEDTGMEVLIERTAKERLKKQTDEQQAEIERLTETLNATIAGQESLQNYIPKAKSEARREFAERVKEMVDYLVELLFRNEGERCKVRNCHKPDSVACGSEVCIQENKAVWHGKIDNLLKEMEREP